MNKQLDRLFKEKLENHEVPPSEAAWSKVEASLNKERKGIVWFRAAAAIVLLGTVTTTFFLMRAGEEQAIAKVDSVRMIPTPKAVPAPKKKQHIREPKLPMVKSSRKVTVFIAREENKNEVPVPAPSGMQEQTIAAVNETSPPVIQPEKPEVINAKHAITLTYTLPAIPPRVENVTAEERNGLQKVVDVAMDAKNSDGALAELRTMKDELFALNFRKNNKK